MKKMLFTTLLFATSLFANEEVVGTWNTGRYNTVVMIHQKENGEYAGTIISSDNPNAPVGNEMLRDLSNQSDIWQGKIYVARRDRALDATLSPEGDVLEINIDAGRRSRTVEWTRVDSE